MKNLRAGYSAIYGIGGHLPSNTVRTSDVLSEINCERYGINSQFFEQTMGIYESRYSEPDQVPSDLAKLAAEPIIEESGVNPDHIDLIIFCGIDRDFAEPSTAHKVQEKLGIKQSIVFDISNACHGFMDGIMNADALIATGAARYALIVTGEQPSHVTRRLIERLKSDVSPDEFKLKVGGMATGDSGAAMLIGPKNGKGIKMTQSCSRGEFSDLCYYKKTEDGIEGQLVMGPLSANAIKMHRTIYPDSMEYLHWNPEDIDHLVTHQVGNRLFERFSKIFNVNQAKMSKTFDKLGNLISATIPINLWMLQKQGLLTNRQVFVAGSGSGLSISQWGIDF